jgi:integrase
MFEEIGKGLIRFTVSVRVPGVSPRKRVTIEPCTPKKAKDREAILKALYKAELERSLTPSVFTIKDAITAYLKGNPDAKWGDRPGVATVWAGHIKLDKEAMLEMADVLARYKRTESAKTKRIPTASTVNKMISIVKASSRYCYIHNLVDRDWLIALKKEEEHNERAVYVSPEMFDKIMDHLPGTWKPITLCAYLTGMRQGELRNLLKSDMDLFKRRFYLRLTKEGRSRQVPIPDEMVDYLTRCSGTYVFECGGERMKKMSIINAFKRAAAAAEITGVKFHDLRGTFGTDLFEGGASPKVIMEIMGHYTQRMYVRYQKVRDCGQLDDALKLRNYKTTTKYDLLSKTAS